MKKLCLVFASVVLLISPAVASAGGAKLKIFQAARGNIACALIKQQARCDIAQHKWSAPAKPKSCKLDYGNGLYVGKHGPGDFTCAGDTVLGSGHKIGGDEVRRVGRFRCKTGNGAVRCTNTRTKHGFKISRKHANRF